MIGTVPRCAVALIATVALAGCSTGSGSSDQADAGGDSSGAAEGCSQTQAISEWPIGRRVTQMLMGGVSTENGESAVDAAIESVAKGRVGGVNFLGNNASVYADNQLAQAVDAGGSVPPFLAVDQEGGRVQRLIDITGYLPSAREMGQTMTPAEVKKEARAIGRTMAKLSLNMNLAPVVDVSDQDSNAVIGDRSFSDDPEKVTVFADAFADGLQQSDVVPVVKHFPGLGDGSGNTDFQSATTPRLSDLRNKDLIPYETVLKNEPIAVMTTNAAVPGLTSGKPASISAATYRLLREDYGFDGVVMTDSLSAASIQADRSLSLAVRQALIAGADIALWDSLGEAKQIRKNLTTAVKRGLLPEQQVNDSVARILALKGVDLCIGR